jgi:hypothetical protein
MNGVSLLTESSLPSLSGGRLGVHRKKDKDSFVGDFREAPRSPLRVV